MQRIKAATFFDANNSAEDVFLGITSTRTEILIRIKPKEIFYEF